MGIYISIFKGGKKEAERYVDAMIGYVGEEHGMYFRAPGRRHAIDKMLSVWERDGDGDSPVLAAMKELDNWRTSKDMHGLLFPWEEREHNQAA